MTADTSAPPAPAEPLADDPAITALGFAEASAELRAAVAELEAGGLSLEDTIARTERAVALQRHCEKLLAEAELRVKQLVNRPRRGLEARGIAIDEASEG